MNAGTIHLRFRRFILLGSLLLLPSREALAQGESGFLLTLGTKAEYNDNIFIADSGRDSDLLFALLPHAEYDLVTVPVEMNVWYAPQFILPVKHFDDSTVRRILHIGEFNAVSELANGIKLELMDQGTAVPANFGTPGNSTANLIQTNLVRFTPSLSMEVGGRSKLSASVNGERFDASQAGSDRTGFGGEMELVRDFGAVFSLGLRGRGQMQLFDSSTVGDTTLLGVEAVPTLTFSEELQWYASVGWGWFMIDGGGSHGNLMIDTELAYSVGEKHSLKLGFLQAFLTDPVGESFTAQQFRVSGKKHLGPTLEAGVDVAYGRYKQVVSTGVGTSSPLTDTLLTIQPGLWYTLSPKLQLQAGYSWSLNRGENAANNFENNVAFVMATYTFLGEPPG